MFNPSQHDVRRFFCEAFRKHRENQILTPLEADYSVEQGQTNPFLHLSMHLSISEQISIDQPPGIRKAFQALAQRKGSEHEAQHEIMECLGEVIWNSQRSGLPPDSAAYIESIRRR